jgi:hypothetical protein
MRPDGPNTRQSAYDSERTRAHQRATIAGALIVLAAIAVALLVFYMAYLPSGAPDSGSTSTSAEVAPVDAVGPSPASKPGIDADGR